MKIKQTKNTLIIASSNPDNNPHPTQTKPIYRQRPLFQASKRHVLKQDIVYKQSTAYNHLNTPTSHSYQHPLTTNQHGRMSIQHTKSMQPMQQKEPTPLYISRKGQRIQLQPRQLPHSLQKLGNSALQPVGFGPQRTGTNDTSSRVHPSRTRYNFLIS